jgi:hypothetical protein
MLMRAAFVAGDAIALTELASGQTATVARV